MVKKKKSFLGRGSRPGVEEELENIGQGEDQEEQQEQETEQDSEEYSTYPDLGSVEDQEEQQEQPQQGQSQHQQRQTQSHSRPSLQSQNHQQQKQVITVEEMRKRATVLASRLEMLEQRKLLSDNGTFNLEFLNSFEKLLIILNKIAENSEKSVKQLNSISQQIFDLNKLQKANLEDGEDE